MPKQDGPEIGVLLDAVRESRCDPALLESFGVSWAEELGVDGYGLWARVLGMRLRWIVAGRYVRGSPPEELGRRDNEGPEHEVELTLGFWLGETPVTQANWESVMSENPSHFRGPDLPVERVSWDDAQQYCARLGERVPGLYPRLPTEAEWEYACRAGTVDATYAGELEGLRESAVLDEIAWYSPNANDSTHVVGSKRANPWGLHDMLGNVFEWCEDAWSGYSSTAFVDPMPSAGSLRVFRGGSWNVLARYVRAAFRLAAAPRYRTHYLGIRLAAGPQRSTPGAEPRSSA